ncbi:UNVERIFIED_CONTAM: Stem-specific protein TSJT1 [Sesamum calycinum]|uniref:Stem-specific protein TSJT1 n=1 Tax=Sesamum calycinum TaxID=2727403 RepID=A0AAW2Q6G7_9LAMI
MSPYPFLEERKMIIGSCKFAHRTKLHSWFYSGYSQVLTTRTSSENKRAEAVDATYMTAFVSLPALPIVFQSLLQKMLAVFEKSIANPPKELSLPVGRNHSNSSPEEIAEIFRSWRSDSTFYNLSSGNFLALSHRDENPAHPSDTVSINKATEANDKSSRLIRLTYPAVHPPIVPIKWLLKRKLLEGKVYLFVP